MCGTGAVEKKHTNKDAIDQARQGVERAEFDDTAGARQLDKAWGCDPARAEAVEQEASDGPAGRGLSR